MTPQLEKPYYMSVARVMRERILSGDYALKPIPSERILAAELGVNYMTVRRGLSLLESEGILSRQSNGRMCVSSEKEHRNIAILVPSGISQNIHTLRSSLERAASDLPCNVRAVLFHHWEDQTLRDAVEGFDGTFLYSLSEAIPPAVLHFLQRPQNKVVALEHNLSLHGIPTIRPFPPVFVEKALNHLKALGHTRIGCLNTQRSGTEVSDRINQWRHWMKANGLQGKLIDLPSSTNTGTLETAYQQMKDMLKNREQPMLETAWICITGPIAMAAMRAILDHGLQPGKDIAVCAINGERFATFLNPRLSALEQPDMTPLFKRSLEWMLGGSEIWQGPLMMQPAQVPFVARESTLGPGAADQTL